MSVRRVALLTAGGFAPCLSSAVGGLIERYTELDPEIEIIAYQYGYHGLLTGTKIVVDSEGRRQAGTSVATSVGATSAAGTSSSERRQPPLTSADSGACAA